MGYRFTVQLSGRSPFLRFLTSALVAFVLVMSLTSCGNEDPGGSLGEGGPSPSNSTPDPFARPSIDGRFVIGGGRALAIRCWGEGKPTVILETGHPNPGGIQDFEGSQFAAELAERTRVCAYDRAGTGASDPAPRRPRTADDVTQDLNALLDAAEVEGPCLLIGASFGGMIVTYYASQYPEGVLGVALLDVPPPSDELTVEEIPEIAWDHPENPEHVDVVNEFEGRFAREPVPFEAPILVITALQGQSSVREQRFWLKLSPEGRQVELDGGHDVWLDNPQATATEVLEFLEEA